MDQNQDVVFHLGGKVSKLSVPKKVLPLVVVVESLASLEPSPNSRERQQTAFRWINHRWNRALMWVIQQQSNERRNQSPYNTPEFKSARPLGEFLNSWFDLIAGMVGFLDDLENAEVLDKPFTMYRDAHEWFWELVLEQELGDIFTSVFADDSPMPYVLPDQGEFFYECCGRVVAVFQGLENREAIVSQMRMELSHLRKRVNPYAPETPHMYRMVELAITIMGLPIIDPEVSKSQRAIKKHWETFLDTYQALVKQLHEGKKIKTIQMDGDKIYEVGVGGQKKLIDPPPSAGSSLKIPRKKRTPKR
jgi:hypothetical protein